ncbi:hypothetical protein [Allosphingosinicella sp.]|jgi:hypothetical protein|uniref:hypothetical protein n=1 Tax=Allosphingosinicella sp. TaxID=2823234 RepID=UPI002EE4BC10
MQDEPTETPIEPDSDENEPEAYGDEDGYTSAEFHNVIQKQIAAAALDTLVASKMDWATIEPFLRAARNISRGDFQRTGRIQVHGVAADGEAWSEAEEAYLSLSVADQDDGSEWLSETWWLSDLVVAGGDPGQVREAVGAIEKSLARLKAWLDEHGGPAGEGAGAGAESTAPDEAD